jgi:hypothetical protein
MSAQSRNLCIPFKIMMGRETKEAFADFGLFLKFLECLLEEATLSIESTGFLPFSCRTTCNLSVQWKGLCKGGAAKVHTLPCNGCATESDVLITPNTRRPCIRWCTEQAAADPDWRCYHKPMASPERVATIKNEVAELVATLERALLRPMMSHGQSHALMSSSIIRPKFCSKTICRFTFYQKLKPRNRRFLICLL